MGEVRVCSGYKEAAAGDEGAAAAASSSVRVCLRFPLLLADAPPVGPRAQPGPGAVAIRALARGETLPAALVHAPAFAASLPPSLIPRAGPLQQQLLLLQEQQRGGLRAAAAATRALDVSRVVAPPQQQTP
jgi:hypothetical protein